ncbi:hypothetical protein RN001_014544 [Aquatica leii]|uniref:DUF4806 domain-containing protein n=1 Tax=Aquatica leii TaxID=1421715 RepID=A0AAN7NUN3_9COLE|nr:hypothetical protein RN001_014544 [Aquatica leii]
MSGKKVNLNDRDIEDYLSKLQDGWLSEDGLDDQDSDDENRDADEIIRVLQEENDDDYDDVDETGDIDPPLVEPEDQEPFQSSHPSTSSNLQSSSSFAFDKRSLIRKKKGIWCMTQIKLLSWEVLLLQCTHLQVLGGKGLFDTTRTILGTIIHQDLAVECNWSGKNNKPAFSKFKNVVLLILGAVRQHRLLKDTTQKEVEDIIKGWLRTATDRNGGRSRRSKQQMNN